MSCRGGDSVKVVFSREMEQFCIMILVMAQKPVPVIKFHRDIHNKTDISDYHLYFSNILSILTFWCMYNICNYYIQILYVLQYNTMLLPSCCGHS